MDDFDDMVMEPSSGPDSEDAMSVASSKTTRTAKTTGRSKTTLTQKPAAAKKGTKKPTNPRTKGRQTTLNFVAGPNNNDVLLRFKSVADNCRRVTRTSQFRNKRKYQQEQE